MSDQKPNITYYMNRFYVNGIEVDRTASPEQLNTLFNVFSKPVSDFGKLTIGYRESKKLLREVVNNGLA